MQNLVFVPNLKSILGTNAEKPSMKVYSIALTKKENVRPLVVKRQKHFHFLRRDFHGVREPYAKGRKKNSF